MCQWIIMCEMLCWDTYQRHMTKLANVMLRKDRFVENAEWFALRVH